MPRYYAPAFQIKVDGLELQADVSKFVQEVSVVSKPDMMDTFSFTLANPLPKMPFTHGDDAELFEFGSQVTILMGYVDDQHQMMFGDITSIHPSFPGGGVPTVGIEGKSLMYRLTGCNKTRTFQKAKPHDIVNQVGTQAGLSVQIDDPVNLDLDYVIQANQTDLDFLKTIAKRHHRELVVTEKTLIFRKPNPDEGETLEFIWCGTQESFAPPPDTLPLISFTPTMEALNPASSVQVRSWDPMSKQVMVSTANSSHQGTLPPGTISGADVAANKLNRNCPVVHVTAPFASQEEGDRMSSSYFNEKALGFTGGSAETIGIPQLMSGQKIKLSGLGKIFSGEYLVDEVTHSMGESGYTTTFTVKSGVQGNG